MEPIFTPRDRDCDLGAEENVGLIQNTRNLVPKR